MWATLKKLIHDCLTENDGQSYCPVRVLGMSFGGGGGLTFLAATVYMVVKHGTFDPGAFATAFVGIMGGFGLLGGTIALKAKTDTGG